MTYEKNNHICYDIYDVNYNGCSFYGGSCIGGGEKASKRQVTLIRSYNKIYRKCKKNFKYDGPQLEMNQDSYKEFKIWDKELNRVYKLLYKGLSAKQKKVLKKKQIRWIKKKEKEAAKEAAQWAGGSGQPLARNMVLITETKKRLRWLIRTYA